MVSSSMSKFVPESVSDGEDGAGTFCELLSLPLLPPTWFVFTVISLTNHHSTAAAEIWRRWWLFGRGGTRRSLAGCVYHCMSIHCMFSAPTKSLIDLIDSLEPISDQTAPAATLSDCPPSSRPVTIHGNTCRPSRCRESQLLPLKRSHTLGPLHRSPHCSRRGAL
jgi:hypothetical protein